MADVRYVRSTHKHGRLTHVYKCDHILQFYGKRYSIFGYSPLKPGEYENDTREPRPKCLCGTIITHPRWSRIAHGTMCPRCEEILEASNALIP